MNTFFFLTKLRSSVFCIDLVNLSAVLEKPNIIPRIQSYSGSIEVAFNEANTTVIFYLTKNQASETEFNKRIDTIEMLQGKF